MNSPLIFITAAEVSGDVHGAKLIEALRRRLPDARFMGVGGPRMAAGGCELVANPVGKAAMLGGGIQMAAYFHGVIKQAKAAMAAHRPAVHVPVDSPAMNWHLAKAAKALGVPVMYYVAPQVWAWAPWRVKKVRKLTDAVACILPFEEDYLRQRRVNARFVGHPLLEELPAPELPDLDAAAASGRWKIAMLPGSRDGEIRGHAAALADMSDRLRTRYPDAQVTFAAFDEAAAEKFRRFSGRDDLSIVAGQTEQVLAGSHFAVVASGTATLMTACFGVPMVIVHKGSWLGYNLVARWLIRTKYLSLVNILAGYELSPELMPWFGNRNQLWRAVEGLLGDTATLKATRQKLLELVKPLRIEGGSAAGNTAELVIEVMRK